MNPPPVNGKIHSEELSRSCPRATLSTTLCHNFAPLAHLAQQSNERARDGADASKDLREHGLALAQSALDENGQVADFVRNCAKEPQSLRLSFAKHDTTASRTFVDKDSQRGHQPLVGRGEIGSADGQAVGKVVREIGHEI
jgi:hypothetical protein